MGIGDNVGVNKTGSDSLYVKKKKEEELKLQKPDTTALMKAELQRLNNAVSSEQKTPKEFTFARFSTDNMTDEEVERLSQEWLATPSPANNTETTDVETETAAQVQQDEAAEETPETEQNTPPEPGSPDRYKGENKPAATANWADLNGKYFEVIDEPDANGKLPTRPIHGEIKVEGEAKNEENPKKFTITDKDNGVTYTFELDESVEDKVMYKCTSGKGAYSKGNSYELRTINGVPMLVQMSDMEGHGTSIGKTGAPKPTTPPKDSTPVEDTPPAEDTPPTQDAPPVEGEDNLTPKQRQAKIDEDAASLEPDLTPKMKIDEELKAKAEAISKAMQEAPVVAKDIKTNLKHSGLTMLMLVTLLQKLHLKMQHM